jgi:N-acetylglutamate synthase-like GNAT family acetyltransferase
VRHATEADLDGIDGLLGRLRRVDGLVERKRGTFQHRSKAFLHFHEDAGEIYADVRLGDDFVRFRVATPAEQKALVDDIEAFLSRRP